MDQVASEKSVCRTGSTCTLLQFRLKASSHHRFPIIGILFYFLSFGHVLVCNLILLVSIRAWIGMPETFHENFDTRDTNGQFVLVICSFVGSLSPNTAMLAGTCQVAGHWSHGVVALQDAHSARQADALVCRQFASQLHVRPPKEI